jgi:hypothetical protein
MGVINIAGQDVHPRSLIKCGVKCAKGTMEKGFVRVGHVRFGPPKDNTVLLGFTEVAEHPTNIGLVTISWYIGKFSQFRDSVSNVNTASHIGINEFTNASPISKSCRSGQRGGGLRVCRPNVSFKFLDGVRVNGFLCSV